MAGTVFRFRKVGLYDRFGRSVPVLGLGTFFMQARCAILEARREDAAFRAAMDGLQAAYADRLADQSERLEWWTIVAVSVTAFVVWTIALRHWLGGAYFDVTFLAAGGVIFLLDFVVGRAAEEVFVRLERRLTPDPNR